MGVISNQRVNTFADGVCFSKLFWIFFLTSIFGVIFETIYCLFTKNCLESRQGLIYGPFNPVYGFGAILMTIILQRFRGKNIIYLFLASAIIGGVFEYLCSLFQENVFGTISWDYSSTPINIHGRTNIILIITWGILGALWIKFAFPFVSKMIEKINPKFGNPLTVVFAIFMCLNLAISGLAVARQADRRNGIVATNSFLEVIDRTYSDDFLKTIYPNMEVVAKK